MYHDYLQKKILMFQFLLSQNRKKSFVVKRVPEKKEGWKWKPKPHVHVRTMYPFSVQWP